MLVGMVGNVGWKCWLGILTLILVIGNLEKLKALSVSGGLVQLSSEAMVIRLLLAEAVSRVVKNELNRKLREKVWELKQPLEVFFFF
jgi:hypothetical protein